MSEKRRVVFHLDMDHFYTAVEEREQPEMRATPSLVTLFLTSRRVRSLLTAGPREFSTLNFN